MRSYCGHGIHRLFHTAPSIPHYASLKTSIQNIDSYSIKICPYILDNKAVGIAKAGNSFTIEPMISMGTWRDEHWVCVFYFNFYFFLRYLS